VPHAGTKGHVKSGCFFGARPEFFAAMFFRPAARELETEWHAGGAKIFLRGSAVQISVGNSHGSFAARLDLCYPLETE
jgi:hypothetical protein